MSGAGVDCGDQALALHPVGAAPAAIKIINP